MRGANSSKFAYWRGRWTHALRYGTRRSWCIVALTIVVLPWITGLLSSILDEIEIISIQAMELKKEKEHYFLETVVTFRNPTRQTVKLSNCAIDLAVITPTSEDLPFAQFPLDMLLLAPGNHPDNPDIMIPLSFDIGNLYSIQTFYQTHQEAFKELLSPTETAIPLHLQAHFDLAIKTKQAWHYIQDVSVDWTIHPDIDREALGDILQDMAQETGLPPISGVEEPSVSEKSLQ